MKDILSSLKEEFNNPERIGVLLTPDEALEAIRALVSFEARIKHLKDIKPEDIARAYYPQGYLGCNEDQRMIWLGIEKGVIEFQKILNEA